MINSSNLIFSPEVSGPGGLFDLDATLLLVVIQFVLLMFILNVILYNPFLTIIEERNEYILTTLTGIGDVLERANRFIIQHDRKIEVIRKESQLQVTNLTKLYKEILEIEVTISQRYIDTFLLRMNSHFLDKREIAINNLDDVVKSLANDIKTKLAI